MPPSLPVFSFSGALQAGIIRLDHDRNTCDVEKKKEKKKKEKKERKEKKRKENKRKEKKRKEKKRKKEKRKKERKEGRKKGKKKEERRKKKEGAEAGLSLFSRFFFPSSFLPAMDRK